MQIEFRGEIWYWRGPAPWFFVTVPAQHCGDLNVAAGVLSYGWGVVPVQVQIGQTTWETSLFPKDGQYIVPIKASIRKAEHLEEGDTVTIRLSAQI